MCFFFYTLLDGKDDSDDGDNNDGLSIELLHIIFGNLFVQQPSIATISLSLASQIQFLIEGRKPANANTAKQAKSSVLKSFQFELKKKKNQVPLSNDNNFILFSLFLVENHLKNTRNSK